MGAKQSLYKGNIQDVLTFFEEETKKWNDNIKNLKISWEKKSSDRGWVPQYLSQQMEETETKWINIRSMIKIENDRMNCTDSEEILSPCCQETIRQVQSELNQMKQNNDEALKTVHEAEHKINEQNVSIEKLKLKISSRGSEGSETNVMVASQSELDPKPLQKSKKVKKEKEDLQELVKSLKKQKTDIEERFQEKLRKLSEENELIKATKLSLESEFNEQKRETESLKLRLSKLASERLIKNNPSITDLSDPNRPAKIGEIYSELYDNQWTDAFEALKEAGHEEQIAIETLSLTLQHVLEFCKTKAELLLKRSSDVNLLFDDDQTTGNEPKIQSHATIQPKQARKVAQIIRQNSTMEEIKFQHDRWMAKTKVTSTNSQQSTEQGRRADSKLDIDSKFKQLRKEIATYIVPVVQKAYMEVNWSNRYIEGLKPFIFECIFISWMMIVQTPPMTFHICEKGTKFDKNLFKEYTSTGPVVKHMVWPALLLNEDGAVVCKGVAEGDKVPK